jgi:hypothetical protein
MNKDEILDRIERIKEDLSKDQYQIMTDKIMDRRFHLHSSRRNPLTKKILEKVRKRLILEIGLILEPILENQKEINLRFLNEIEKLKNANAEKAEEYPSQDQK